MVFYSNTGSTIARGTEAGSEEGRTSTGLSTQIVIKVNDVAVGALQNLTVNQTRGLQRVVEIGTDGVVEIVPNAATTFELEATRVVFDQLRLPEAFSRGFRFINAQRIPFDIEIYDLGNAESTLITPAEADTGTVIMKFLGCWFQRYSTPYAVDNYIINETATIWAETGSQTTPDSVPPNLRGRSFAQTDQTGIEVAVNQGKRRGGVDAQGILNAIFPTS
jgi:hypothetical protein